MALSVLLPIFSFLLTNVIYQSYDKSLAYQNNQEVLKSRFQPFIENIRKGNYIFTSIYITRRLVYSLTLVTFGDNQGLQLIFLMIQNMVMIIYITISKPYLSLQSNYLEIFNEIIFQVILYSMIIFSDNYNLDFEVKIIIGYFPIALSILFLSVNIYIIAISKLATKLWCLLKSNNQKNLFKQQMSQAVAQKTLKKIEQNATSPRSHAIESDQYLTALNDIDPKGFSIGLNKNEIKNMKSNGKKSKRKLKRQSHTKIQLARKTENK
ncbi:UNKNOWN [Stylonychia lemnae]|uniref:Transmembrane protein n=1 Tax=Stylonychia lemnae TaxID=5949 RepID=A0A078AGT3_STYLE|nr:UNKNOWN [Stylonychia lemnae]|eukprot:CDW81414.1 UNKNOWN [Stylonychia lemnae]